MSRRISIYLTQSHASVTIVNGASRETSANNLADVMDAMSVEDMMVLVRFAQAIVAYEDKATSEMRKQLAELIGAE